MAPDVTRVLLAPKMGSVLPACLTRAARLFPKLSTSLRKGDCGRMGVIGGSKEYTGAPYFSAMTQMKMGSDLSYVFCHPQSAQVIKCYSPELIVYPSFEMSQQMVATLGRCNAVVVGPGLGRERDVGLPLMQGLMKYAKEAPNTCLVIDADALCYMPECLEGDYSYRYENVVLTPNHWEFARLYERVCAVGIVRQSDGGDEAKAKQVATALGVCMMLKGPSDIITDGEEVLLGTTPGCFRRCGGLGDILGGAVSLLVYWRSVMSDGEKAMHQRPNYTTKMVMEGCLAASDLARYTSACTYDEMGRSMNAANVIGDLWKTVKAIDDAAGSIPS